jgi:hypothetical protein
LAEDDQCKKIALAFESMSGFPNVVGYIDGTHVPVKAPYADRDSFIYRKVYPSINVLAVCDHTMRFTYVYADCAGSVHDARVLRACSLGQELETGKLMGDVQFHLLDDSAHPLLPNLMVPFRDNGHLTPRQLRLNAIHSSTRCLVERAFGQLKGKFRRSRGINATRLINAVYIVDSAFTLHNFIIDYEDGDSDNWEDDESESSNAMGTECHSEAVSCNSRARSLAQMKRDTIAAIL